MVKATPKPKTAFNARQTFVLGVSLGSPSHESGALEAIVDALNLGNFSKGVVDLSDTLKRYKYINDGMDDLAAIKRARAEGDAWLARNAHILDKLSVNKIEVRRWDEWLIHPQYESTRNLFEELYKTNAELREAIDRDIRNFHERAYGTVGEISPNSYELSRKFFIEELSAHSLLYTETNGVNVYPGKQLECFRVVRDGKVLGAPQALIQSPYVKMVMHSFDRTIQQDRGPVRAVA